MRLNWPFLSLWKLVSDRDHSEVLRRASTAALLSTSRILNRPRLRGLESNLSRRQKWNLLVQVSSSLRLPSLPLPLTIQTARNVVARYQAEPDTTFPLRSVSPVSLTSLPSLPLQSIQAAYDLTAQPYTTSGPHRDRSAAPPTTRDLPGCARAAVLRQGARSGGTASREENATPAAWRCSRSGRQEDNHRLAVAL